jgi:phospholipid/cholesterol/gamma-HCH transport system substrate-binding protein
MMRSRMVREGSVGLFILGGVVVFGGLAFWIRGAAFGQDSYSFTVTFNDATGIQPGAGVRYRGLEVGTVSELSPGITGIETKVKINNAQLRIPDEVAIAANQSGLITETVIDITPLETVENPEQLPSPLAEDCDSQVIICDGDTLTGREGVSFNQLIKSTSDLSELYGDPAFINTLTTTLNQASLAALEFSKLSQELTTFTQTLQTELAGFSEATQAVTNTSQQISQATTQLSQTAEQVSQLSNSAQVTTQEFSQLANNLNSLVVENRSNLVGTLNSLSATSTQLGEAIALLTPTLEEVNTTVTTLDTQQLIQNLETLTANAAEASGNLRDISNTLSDPTNLALLQQTLDSARVTFANTQKITSDLDELTGNPEFRQNFLRLVNGLSSLVSSTEQLEEQVYNAQVLEPMNELMSDSSERPQPKAVKLPTP